MEINEKSTYYERLEFAESAKLKEKYENLGFIVLENHILQTYKGKSLICDLYMTNTATGEKIIFEIKAKNNSQNIRHEIKSLVEKRKTLLKQAPGTKFYLMHHAHTWRNRLCS
jgi:hypothetical protein